MLITLPLKKEILSALRADFEQKNTKQKYTQSRHAGWLNINTSVYSRLSNGSEIEKLLSDSEWVRIGKKLQVDLDGMDWKPAKTKTFTTITKQLMYCMDNSVCGIFCDDSSLGKTFPAKIISNTYPNAAYVDCSGLKTWSKLIRGIARSFGFNVSGSLYEIRQQVIDGIMALEKPLIILDEAGDLNDATVLELKGLWNELEFLCGWYLIGANGLRARMESKVRYNKVGFEELYNRVGGKYQSMTEGWKTGAKEIFKREQIDLVVRAQCPKATEEQIAKMVNACEFNLRRARIEVRKFKSSNFKAA